MQRSRLIRLSVGFASAIAVGSVGLTSPALAAPAAAPAAAAAPVATRAVTPGARAMCTINNPHLRELSGLAASIRFNNILWTHNDSGDKARIYALDATTCRIRATITLRGVNAYDFESIGLGRDRSGRPVIWVGDTGDNYKARSSVRLYRIFEPTRLVNQTVAVRSYAVTYRGGRRDAESLVVDQRKGGRIWIVSKEQNGAMFALPARFDLMRAAVAVPVKSVRPYLTDAALSPNRKMFIVRSGDWGSFYVGGVSGRKRLHSTQFPSQAQGEAITFSRDSRFVYIASEGIGKLIRIPVTSL